MGSSSWIIRCALVILVTVNYSLAIYVQDEGTSGRIRKKDVTHLPTLEWVDEQDLYDYNARDGSLWSDLLEQWTVRSGNASSAGGHNNREGRVLQPNHKYIPTSGFFITKRMGEAAELEPHMRPPGKVITQFRPSQPYGVPMQQQQGTREVSETDLYLLGAIEKLVFRVDYMEQRLRRTEQMVYYLMQGNNAKEENYCPQNFTKVGSKCYHFGVNREVNWQSASSMCKTLGGHLAEFEEKIELKQMVKYLLGQSTDKGKEFWLGGLNPGLLWIWSNSARPINANTNLTLAASSTKLSLATIQKSTESETVEKVKRDDKTNKKQLQSGGSTTNSTAVNYDEIKGSGRCLRLSYNVKKDRYQYSGHDCSARQFYLCEFEDKSLENEINRVSKALFQNERTEDEGLE